MPGPKQTQVTKQFDELDGDTKRYLGDTDVDNPASKSADLFRNAGPDGRRALNDLADTDREAADALLEMDDAATQRRFVKAHQRGEFGGTICRSRYADTTNSTPTDGQSIAA